MLKKRNFIFLCLPILGVFLLIGCFLVANPPYTVSYDGNGNTGGSVPIDDGLYQENQLVTVLSKGDLVNTGFVFAGWNTQADGSGTVQAAASTFTMGAADVILYAQWTSSARYVSKTGDNLNDGRSSDSSWLTISHALSETPDGGTIHVANGTYEEDIIFPTDKVIVLKSINGRNITTIKGTGDDSVVKFSGCPDGTILDGFTVTGGNAESGGGINIVNSSPTIKSNTISRNNATNESGGGIWFDESSLPTIGGETVDDTTDFNTICGNISGGTCTTDNQVDPNDCPNNYICIECAGCGGT